MLVIVAHDWFDFGGVELFEFYDQNPFVSTEHLQRVWYRGR